MSFRSKASVFTSPEGTEVCPLHHCVRLGPSDFVPSSSREKGSGDPKRSQTLGRRTKNQRVAPISNFWPWERVRPQTASTSSSSPFVERVRASRGNLLGSHRRSNQ